MNKKQLFLFPILLLGLPLLLFSLDTNDIQNARVETSLIVENEPGLSPVFTYMPKWGVAESFPYLVSYFPFIDFINAMDGTGTNEVAVYNLETEEWLWRRSLDAVTFENQIKAGKVYVLTRDSIFILSLETGELLSSFSLNQKTFSNSTPNFSFHRYAIPEDWTPGIPHPLFDVNEAGTEAVVTLDCRNILLVDFEEQISRSITVDTGERQAPMDYSFIRFFHDGILVKKGEDLYQFSRSGNPQFYFRLDFPYMNFPPLLLEDRIYLGTNRSFYAIDSSGTLIAKKADTDIRGFYQYSNRIYLLGNKHGLFCLSMDLDELWNFTSPEPVGSCGNIIMDIAMALSHFTKPFTTPVIPLPQRQGYFIASQHTGFFIDFNGELIDTINLQEESIENESPISYTLTSYVTPVLQDNRIYGVYTDVSGTLGVRSQDFFCRDYRYVIELPENFNE